MKFKEFFVKRHVYFYGGICLAANALAVLSSNLTSFPMPDSRPLLLWAEFLEERKFLITALSVFCYAFPCVLCFLYAVKALKYTIEDDEYKAIMVHMPGAFALRGITGWICNFVLEVIFLFRFKSFYGCEISFILISSLASYILLSMFSFTLIYFTLETLNRNLVLPSLYPDGMISSTKRTFLASIKSVFFFYFFSASLFPATFLGIRLFFTKYFHLEIPSYYDFVFMSILLFMAAALTVLISRYFQVPLKKLADGAEGISKGNYEERAVICSNDEMGALGDAFNQMAASLKEKEFMRDTFGKIVTPQIRDYLLTKSVALGGETLEVTVMFCDIRGFTTLSEKMAPEKIVALLNEYFTGLEKCVARHGGVINKYIGDAIMVLFGAPIPSATHASDALAAALEMRESLSDMNKGWKERGLPEIRFGIGIHSGPVLAGNIGAANRMEYTVIGDTVNTASRIEGLCKTCQKDLLLSQSAADLIQAQKAARSETAGKTETAAAALPALTFVDDAEIRGRKEKVRVFTIA